MEDIQISEAANQQATPIGSLGAGDKVQAIGRKGDWIQIRSGEITGWVPRKTIAVEKIPGVAPQTDSEFDEAISNEFGSSPPKPSKRKSKPIPDVSDEDDIGAPEADDAKGADENEIFDDQMQNLGSAADKKFIKVGGRFYENPNKFADRFGYLEKNDELLLLENSEDRKWLKVRLKLTGEEGWYPAKLVVTVKADQLQGNATPNSLEFELAYGNQGYNFGFGGGFFRNLLTSGTESRPRDRFEVGLNLAYFVGENFTSGSKTLSSRFLVTNFLGRYLFGSADGYLAGGFEGGLAYTNGTVENSGFDQSVLIADGLADGTSGVRGVLGARGMVAFNPSWSAAAGLRFHISSNLISIFYLGSQFRF